MALNAHLGVSTALAYSEHKLFISVALVVVAFDIDDRILMHIENENKCLSSLTFLVSHLLMKCCSLFHVVNCSFVLWSLGLQWVCKLITVQCNY
jgi:hypothetical protein